MDFCRSVVQAVNDVVRDQGPQSPLAAVLPDPGWIKHPLLAEVSGFNKNRDMFRYVKRQRACFCLQVILLSR